MWFLFVILVSLIEPSEPAASDAVPFCGTATIQGALRDLGTSLTSREIEERVRQLYPKIDLARMSLDHVMGAIRSCGYSARAVKCKAEAVDDIPTPAILYLPPTRDSKGIGHYILLRRIEDGNAFVEDLTMQTANRVIPVTDLWSYWSGVAVVFQEPSGEMGSDMGILMVVSGLVLVSALTLLLLRPRMRNAMIKTGTAVGMVCLLTGCGNDALPLSCDRAAIELAPMKAGGEASACFELSAWGKSAVRITGISKSCECIATGNGDLVGTVIAPGSSNTVCLSIPTHGRSGLAMGTISLETDPQQDPPLSLKISTFVESDPTLVSASPLKFKFFPHSNSRPLTAVISLSRVPDKPTLELDLQNSDLRGLSLLNMDFNSTELAPAGSHRQHNFKDMLSLTLAVPDDLHSAVSDVARLAFTGHDAVVSVPFGIAVEHPLRLELTSLYVHEVERGQEKKFRVAFVDPPFELGSAAFTIDSSVEWVDASLDSSCSGINIALTAPDSTGRHDGNLTLLSSDSRFAQVPGLAFPISVNVTE